MRNLIVYGSTEGHTRALVHFAAEQLHAAGHTALTEEAGPDPDHPNPKEYDVTFLAGSVHVGRYQPALTAYARAQHETLNARPSAFISVSLSAAGANPNDWEGLDQCLVRFEHETLWTPKAVHQAAGAILYSQYDFFERLALKHIAAERGQRTHMSTDYDFTDYEALKTFVLGFVAAQTAKGAA
jgi:menaquinone-dependent protoporphyrinogen oxidase